MKSKLQILLTLLSVMAPLLGVLPGCNGPDNPVPKSAPPPPPPKAEELTVPKTGATKTDYGASSKYQKSMERLNKAGQ